MSINSSAAAGGVEAIQVSENPYGKELNAHFPIDLIVEGSDIELRFEQLIKQELPISSTPLFITTEVNPVHQ